MSRDSAGKSSKFAHEKLEEEEILDSIFCLETQSKRHNSASVDELICETTWDEYCTLQWAELDQCWYYMCYAGLIKPYK